MSNSLENNFYSQQKIVRHMILYGDSNSDKFWEEHSKMVTLQLKLYGKRLGTSVLLAKRNNRPVTSVAPESISGTSEHI